MPETESTQPSEAAETTAGEREVEALLLADCPCGHSIRAHDDEHICWGSECECERDRYEAILASDWLAALLDRVRREEGERIAQVIEAQIPPPAMRCCDGLAIAAETARGNA